jgi:hypothetical protein
VGVDFGAKGAKKFLARIASAEQGGNIEPAPLSIVSNAPMFFSIHIRGRCGGNIA